MKRKLVKQGAATLMVSIPSKWAKLHHLDKGDELEIEERNNVLILAPKENARVKEKKITLKTHTESAIRTYVTTLYRTGYDRISISASKPETIKIIEELVEKQLLGFEITKKKGTECEIETISEPSADQFNNIFSKMILNIEELFDIVDRTLNGGKEAYEETEQRIARFDNACRRIIIKQKYEEDQLKWSFHTSLNHSQREIYHLLQYLSKNKVKTTKESKDLLNKLREFLNLIKEAYLKKDIAYLESLHTSEKETIYKTGYVSFKKTDPVVVHHLLGAIRNLYLASSPLIGLFLAAPQNS